MFSTFPGGGPGVGLFLLRFTLGISAIVHGGTSLLNGSPLTGLLAIASGTLLLLGFLTPIAGSFVGIAALVIAYSRFLPPLLNLAETKWWNVSIAILGLAVVLLGPGAFSIDARLFGRREIIIPPSSSRR